MPTIGIIGGSGIYDLPGLLDVREVRVRTPFGAPSDAFRVGRLGDATVVFLARHGRGHVLTPTEVPSRANVWGFKSLGVERLISFSAVGSLREELAPGHVVLPDQAIDKTVGRPQTFFGEGVVAHVPFGEPTCAEMRGVLHEAATEAGAPAVHRGGTLVVMEGPAFSTKAESELHRSIGASLIGMTMLPEAKLARESELCYATVALVTDYDCWREGHDAVTADDVVAVIRANAEVARKTAALAVAKLAAAERTCACGRALSTALLTAPGAIPPVTRHKLALLLDRVLPATATAVAKPTAVARPAKAAKPKPAAKAKPTSKPTAKPASKPASKPKVVRAKAGAAKRTGGAKARTRGKGGGR